MSKAADLARTASASETALSNRNLMINGDMQIFQRTAAATAGANTYQTADRWIILEFSSGAFTSEKYTMSLAELNTTGHGQALELNVTTADTSIGADEFCAVRQVIEAQNLQQLQYGTAAAKDLTLSFWVKSKIAGIYCAQILKVDSTTYFLPVEYTINSVDTWEYKTITFTPTAGSTSLITNSGGIINNDNGAGMQVTFGLAWGSSYHGANNTWTADAKYSTSNQVNWMSSTSNDFYLTGVQLEVGPAATPFEHRSVGQELFLCERYFQSLVNGELVGSKNTAARMRITAKLEPEMRAVPTVTRTSTNVVFQGVAESMTSTSTASAQAANSGTKCMAFDLAGFSSLAARSYGGADSNPTIPVFNCDAEL